MEKRKLNRDNNYNFITTAEVKKDGSGWQLYAGPYKPVAENDQIRKVVEDIKKNKRDKYSIIRSGSQANIYIIPNYYILSNRRAIPHGSEDAIKAWQEINGITNQEQPEQPEGVDQPFTEALLTTPSYAASKPSEVAVAEEVFEDEGGASWDDVEVIGVPEMRAMSLKEELARRPSPPREDRGEDTDLLPSVQGLPPMDRGQQETSKD